MLLARLIGALGLAHLVLGALAATVLLSEPTSRRYGDNLQIALPALAWGCAATRGGGREFALRFASMFVIAHSSKLLLGDTALNQRPSGGGQGFPSAHTAAAAIGASSLMQDCLRGNAGAQAVVVIAAAFVGASRIEVGAHDIWQVLAGAILGWAADRALRRDSRARRRVILGLVRLTATARRGCLAARVWLVRLSAFLGRRLLPASALVLSLCAADPARAEIVISLYGGGQSLPRSTIHDSGLGDATVGWRGKSFAMPPYWGARATLWRNARSGFGIEINHAKAYADTPSAYGYDVLEMTDGLNVVTANLWRRWRSDSRWTPYVGAGAGVAVPHVEVQRRGGPLTFEYQLTGPAVQWVAGASWDINAKWSVFGEDKGTWSRHRMKLDAGSTLKTDIIANAVNLGLSYRF